MSAVRSPSSKRGVHFLHEFSTFHPPARRDFFDDRDCRRPVLFDVSRRSARLRPQRRRDTLSIQPARLADAGRAAAEHDPDFDPDAGRLHLAGHAGGIGALRRCALQTFDRRNTPQMPSSVVRALLESRRGELWIGTNAGLLRLLDGQFTAYTTLDGLTHNLVNALAETEDGAIWVGTAGGGLDRLRDGAFTHYSTREGLSGDVVTALQAGQDGSVWVGTTKGLNRINGERVDSYSTADGLANGRVQALCGDGAGGVWVGTERGLHHLRDGNLKLYTKRDG